MKVPCNRIALVLISFVFTVTAFADIPSPNKNTKKPPQPANSKVRMTVKPTRGVTEATLIIPRNLLKEMNAEANGDDSFNAATTSRFNMTGTQTIMFGLFLSASLIMGGVWFARSRVQNKNHPRVAMTIALIALFGATTTAVYANMLPTPIAGRSLTSKILAPELEGHWGAYGEVKIEYAESGTQIVLQLPIPESTETK